MTRTESDLLTSLENRVRAKDILIADQHDVMEAQALLIERLSEMTAYLLHAVDLLSLPRQSPEDVRFVMEGLELMEPIGKDEVRH
jgi:hypothetical protein